MRHLYTDRAIPTDQYKRRPADAARFLNDWNEMADREDCWEDVYHYLINARKNRQLPALGAGHKRLAAVPQETLSEAEWRVLEQVYGEVVKCQEVGSDSLLFNASTSSALARAFHRRTNRSLPGSTLTALIVARRKRGEWTKLNNAAHPKIREETGLGWGDIGEVA